MATFKNRTKFKVRKNQDFDKDNIFIEKNGQKINVYNMIQEANDDLCIYDVLEKYGCIDKIIVNEADVYADLTHITDLRGVVTQQKKADELWKSLPWEMRKEFGNSKENFLENGAKYLEAKIKEKQSAEINSNNNTDSKLSNDNSDVA